jgi:6-phosphogluconolactonase/glucosamine-6-phosphate isomerase/deaminase
VRAFLLDEYLSLAVGYPQSYTQVIRTAFIPHVDIEAVHGPDGASANVSSAASAI